MNKIEGYFRNKEKLGKLQKKENWQKIKKIEKKTLVN